MDIYRWSPAAFALASLSAFYRHFRRSRAEAQRLQELGPTTHPTLQDGWRWSTPQPAVALDLKGDADCSVIEIPNQIDSTEKMGLVGGGVLGLIGLGLVVDWLVYAESLIGTLVVVAVLAAGAWGLLWLGAKLIAVELTKDRARLIVRYGVFFHRAYAYPGPVYGTRIHFKQQSSLGAYRTQEAVWTFLFVGGRRYILPVPPLTAAWIAEGLQSWSNR